MKYADDKMIVEGKRLRERSAASIDTVEGWPNREWSLFAENKLLTWGCTEVTLVRATERGGVRAIQGWSVVNGETVIDALAALRAQVDA